MVFGVVGLLKLFDLNAYRCTAAAFLDYRRNYSHADLLIKVYANPPPFFFAGYACL